MLSFVQIKHNNMAFFISIIKNCGCITNSTIAFQQSTPYAPSKGGNRRLFIPLWRENKGEDNWEKVVKLCKLLYTKVSCWLILMILTSTFSVAQTPVETGDMETWDYDSGGDYYEPAGYWATANPVSKLSALAPVTTFRETDNVYAGIYAAKMVTGVFVALPVAGTLYTGEFDDTQITNPADAVKLGVPYTDRPTRFTGHYMYFPENGDSAAIVCQFTKNSQLIGQGALVVYSEVSSYTAFDLEIDYYTADMPDSMSVVFSSSAGGQDFMAEAGSTLYIDEVAFEFETGLQTPLMPEVKVNLYPNPTSTQLFLNTDVLLNNGEVAIFDVKGTLIQEEKMTALQTELSVQHLNVGIYFYQIMEQGRIVAAGKFEKR